MSVGTRALTDRNLGLGGRPLAYSLLGFHARGGRLSQGTRAMPLEDDERIISDYEATLCEFVHKEFCRCAGDDELRRAIGLLYTRIGEGYLSARTLREFASHRWVVDGVVILRTLMDATMQLLWMLAEPNDRLSNAKLYLGFTEIEHHKVLKSVLSSGTDMGEALANSPNLPEGEKYRHERLIAVGVDYLTKEGKELYRQRGDSYLIDPNASYRANWYPFSGLDVLTAKVGYFSEYKLLQKDWSKSVHASAAALLHRPTIKPEFVLTLAMTFALRAAGAIVETYSISLTEDQSEVIDHAKRNVGDKPEPPSEDDSGESEANKRENGPTDRQERKAVKHEQGKTRSTTSRKGNAEGG